ncbi:hypothetical protein TASIC1_0004007800 [Trichoderma asperellum]|uniref:Uncharacterized protein n=1 Tax=Trichoderma asperellum TaxID=101201 RepID=A0A6V8QPK1_TRIAP|nr:hypothetical protein TASIC1_0004007800 [Trichoderma asperellum]
MRLAERMLGKPPGGSGDGGGGGGGRGGRGNGRIGGAEGGRGRGGSSSIDNRRDGSDAIPALGQSEGQAGEAIPPRRRRKARSGVYRTTGIVGQGRDGCLCRKQCEHAFALGLSVEEDLPPQEQQQQLQQQQQQQQQYQQQLNLLTQQLR